MFVLRNHLTGALFASFGAGLCLFALMSRETGHQDTASSPAHRSSVSKRWQERAPAGTSPIHLAVYSPPAPVRTLVPQVETYRDARLDNGDVSDITGSIPRNRVLQTPPRYQASDYPKVDRTLKGDRLVTFAPSQTVAPPEIVAPAVPAPEDPSRSNSSVFGAKSVEAPSAPSDPDVTVAASQPLP